MTAIDDFSRLLFDTSQRQWLLYNRGKVQAYLDACVNKGVRMSEHRSQWNHLYYERPLLGRNVVEDFWEPNQKKYDMILRKLAGTPGAMSLILGQVGKGKTAFGTKVLDDLHNDHGIEVGMIHSTLSKFMPHYIKQGRDIFNLDPDTMWFLDEGSLHANARNAMTTDNKELGMLMNIRRHQNLTLMFASQHHGFIDINIMRGAHFFFFKQLSWEEQAKKQKDTALSYLMEFVRWMMPRHPSETLFTDGDKWMKIKADLPDFWSDDISQSYRKWAIEDAVDFIRDSMKEGMDIKAIHRELTVRGFRDLTNAEIRRIHREPDAFLSDYNAAKTKK
jgi:hypothetical protein